MLTLGWIRRAEGRKVVLTRRGTRALDDVLPAWRQAEAESSAA